MDFIRRWTDDRAVLAVQLLQYERELAATEVMVS